MTNIEAMERCEFEFDGSLYERSDSEHPERAYRRGFQQRAHEIYKALREAGVVDERTMKTIRRFVGITTFNWRYNKRRNKRHLHHDRAPTLTL